MSLPADYHMHTPLCRHATGEPTELAAQAVRIGLQEIGFSEHNPMIRDDWDDWHMLQGDLDQYVEKVCQARRDHPQLTIKLAMEVDFIPGKNEDIQASIQGHDWDFLIGSVHEIDGLLLESKWNISRETGQALWLRYFGLLGEVVSSGYFSLVSHPVRMCVGNPHLPPNFDEELERLAAEATRCDVALELNGYDVLTYPSLVRKLAKACALQRTPVSIGSDAHRPGEVAQAHDPTKEIMREAGLSRIRTWKQRVPEEYSIYQ